MPDFYATCSLVAIVLVDVNSRNAADVRASSSNRLPSITWHYLAHYTLPQAMVVKSHTPLSADIAEGCALRAPSRQAAQRHLSISLSADTYSTQLNACVPHSTDE